MCIIQRVIHLSALQRSEKRCVVLELASNTTPNNLRLGFSLRESSNQHMKAVTTPSALVMHNVILARNRCPDQTLPWKGGIRDNVRRFPLLARFGEPTAVVRAKS